MKNNSIQLRMTPGSIHMKPEPSSLVDKYRYNSRFRWMVRQIVAIIMTTGGLMAVSTPIENAINKSRHDWLIERVLWPNLKTEFASGHILETTGRGPLGSNSANALGMDKNWNIVGIYVVMPTLHDRAIDCIEKPTWFLDCSNTANILQDAQWTIQSIREDLQLDITPDQIRSISANLISAFTQNNESESNQPIGLADSFLDSRSNVVKILIKHMWLKTTISNQDETLFLQILARTRTTQYNGCNDFLSFIDCPQTVGTASLSTYASAWSDATQYRRSKDADSIYQSLKNAVKEKKINVPELDTALKLALNIFEGLKSGNTMKRPSSSIPDSIKSRLTEGMQKAASNYRTNSLSDKSDILTSSIEPSVNQLGLSDPEMRKMFQVYLEKLALNYDPKSPESSPFLKEYASKSQIRDTLLRWTSTLHSGNANMTPSSAKIIELFDYAREEYNSSKHQNQVDIDELVGKKSYSSLDLDRITYLVTTDRLQPLFVKEQTIAYLQSNARKSRDWDTKIMNMISQIWADTKKSEANDIFRNVMDILNTQWDTDFIRWVLVAIPEVDATPKMFASDKPVEQVATMTQADRISKRTGSLAVGNTTGSAVFDLMQWRREQDAKKK